MGIEYISYADINELDQKFNEVMEDIDKNPDQFYSASFWMLVFVKVFGKMPHLTELASEGAYMHERHDDFQDMDDKEVGEIMRFKNILVTKSMQNVMDAYKDRCVVYRWDEYPVIITNDFFMMYNVYGDFFNVFSKYERLPEEILNLIVDEDKYKDDVYYYYVTSSQHGFESTRLKVKPQEIDFSCQYNDDIPHQKILDFINSDESGLIMLHGAPGTGKTTYIRHLMKILPNKHFLVLDSSVFAYITDSSFISLLLSNQNAVIILEDCEAMITERNENKNISTLLNLSDGIIGDSFNFKFICTFNTQTKNLDKALLRKGRMKVKYEFKELCEEKVGMLAEKIGVDLKTDKPMTLADIYNYGEDNGGCQQETSIGFTPTVHRKKMNMFGSKNV